ncbi:double zinc ribbon domain-containing protein [Loigolactobacillus bifermentans]|jgi:ribosomal protein L40E|uniref:DZANK-type domain-containing protein n=1 Tax=Loigolactobacillus bifermentans DSM 20003 TaxID=1423726 RepID=A0A0R1H011_9LACO|nr:zinc ribbon domain-containing protein [Loigolactobacillus bifermentans]KRK39797.1 hypothetical protein FC07_GL002290 [Loigolactobacillus bifermentans DSM 20003]QGG60975.1 hypothetical protein LB003_11140 [Loigolactobacillus bifermentans]
MEMTFERLVCAHCGAEVPFGSFCSECGEKLFEDNGAEHYQTSFCVNCGAMTPDAKYCTRCGYEKNYQHYF